jgi:N-acetylglucosamine kinase-like BadF-type ATPase
MMVGGGGYWREVMRYFLGIDVGSTKTHALIADEGGRAVGFGVSGPGNPDGVGYDGLAQVLQGATNEALATAGIARGEIAGAGFGIGGYDWPSIDREPCLQTIGMLGLNAPVDVVNDAMIGLLAGAEEGWGVAVVAGTSCNCWGRDRERRTGRMTGFSWLSEAAGAGELVQKAIQAVALEWTWRGPSTRLSQAFVELLEARDAEDLLAGLTKGRYHLHAAAAPTVFRVAAEGDPVAHELILWAGRELGSMANGVIRQLGFEELSFEVVMAGSFFNGSPLLAEAMGEAIHPLAPGARLVRLDVPPVVGGVLLGVEQAGVDPLPLRETLIGSTQEMLHEGG